MKNSEILFYIVCAIILVLAAIGLTSGKKGKSKPKGKAKKSGKRKSSAKRVGFSWYGNDPAPMTKERYDSLQAHQK